jgi:hypothetical protein
MQCAVFLYNRDCMIRSNILILFQQARVESMTNWEFWVGLARLYTKNVYARWEETLVKASAYRVTNDIEKGENCWLVQHTKRSEKIVWGQHQFQVYVNKETGEFTCECKTWEHTSKAVYEYLYAYTPGIYDSWCYFLTKTCYVW